MYPTYCERPKISPFREQMITSLRTMLGLDASINLKALANEGCDSIGQGEAIAAHAVVMPVRKG